MPGLQLENRLTLAQASETVARLQSALAQAPSGAPFVVDAGALTEFDTSALAVLLEGGRVAQQRGLPFQVANVPDQLRRLAALYGIEPLLGLQAAPT